MRILHLLLAVGLASLGVACGQSLRSPSFRSQSALSQNELTQNVGSQLFEGMGANVQSAFNFGSDYDKPHAPSPDYRSANEKEDAAESEPTEKAHIDLW